MVRFLYAGYTEKKCEDFFCTAISEIKRLSGEKSIAKIVTSDKVMVECVSFSEKNCLPFKRCDYLIIDTDFGDLTGKKMEKAYKIAEDMKSQIRPDAKLISKKDFFLILRGICEGGI